MNKKKVIIVGLLVIILFVAGAVFWRYREVNKIPKNEELVREKNVKIGDNIKKENQQDEIRSIEDLVIGEYVFENVDTSNWQVYKNNEMGFEIKIPMGWKAIDKSYTIDGVATKNISIKKDDSSSCHDGAGGGCEILISYSDRYSQKMSYYNRINSWKNNYGIEVRTSSVDSSQAIVINVFGGIVTNFFVDSKFWTISTITQGYPEFSKNYPGVVKTFKFLN